MTKGTLTLTRKTFHAIYSFKTVYTMTARVARKIIVRENFKSHKLAKQRALTIQHVRSWGSTWKIIDKCGLAKRGKGLHPIYIGK